MNKNVRTSEQRIGEKVRKALMGVERDVLRLAIETYAKAHAKAEVGYYRDDHYEETETTENFEKAKEQHARVLEMLGYEEVK